jgi:tetratricopeptide (TPR) repeat protein
MKRCALWLALLLLGTTPGQAQVSTEYMKDCEGTDPNLRIPACTRMLESGRLVTRFQVIVLTNRGTAYYKLGQLDRALRDYNEAIALDRSDDFALYSRGVLYAARGDHERAVRDFDQALRVPPSYEYIRRARCASLVKLGRSDAGC